MNANRRLFNHVTPIVRAGLALLCLALPLSSVPADSQASTAGAEHLQWLLTTHDVRHAIHPREAVNHATNDCLAGKGERGR